MKTVALGVLFAIGAASKGCAKTEPAATSPPSAPATSTPSPTANAEAKPLPAPATPAAVKSPSREDEIACVDKWLAAHGLDQYGHPAGAMYAGGTPLFNEVTGQRRDRIEYVYERQPEARKACGR